MLKICFALLILLQAPVSFAKPSGDGWLTEIEVFANQAEEDSWPYHLPWTQTVEFKTENLYQAYREVAEISEESIDIDRHVKYVTRTFAKRLNDWVMEVGKGLEGNMKARYSMQTLYCEKVLRRLMNEVPFKSDYVRGLFYSTLYEEMALIHQELLHQVKLLKLHEEEAKPKGLQFTPLIFGGVLGELINYSLPSLNVSHSNSMIVGIVVFASFYKAMTSELGESHEMSTLQMAIRFGNKVRCENWLEKLMPTDQSAPPQH